MAFAIRRKQENQFSPEFGSLEPSVMQNLQDRFCESNYIYLVCLSQKRGVITKAYGSKEELEYIHSHASMDMHVSLLGKLMNSRENVVEEEDVPSHIRMSGISVKAGNDLDAIWIAVGVMEDTGAEVPECVMTTTPERYDKSIEFLETISKQMFEVRMDGILVHEAFLKSRESEQQIEAELRRNETMASVVRLLESEENFSSIIREILRITCLYLDVSLGVVLRENEDKKTVDKICEYRSQGVTSFFHEKHGILKETLPFFDGKAHLLSVDSIMSDEFQRLFECQMLKAALFLPLDGTEKMYLCFCEKEKRRIWDAGEIKFVNDVRRIVQSILTKQITKDVMAGAYGALEAILEHVECGICVIDPADQSELYCNQYFLDSFRRVIEDEQLEAYFIQGMETENSMDFHEIYSDREKRWFDLHCFRIRWVDGRQVLLWTGYDVTDKKLYQQKIEKQENNDFLTGLYNRMRCEQDLEQYIRQMKAVGGEGALLYIDLDDFKHINEGLGHQYGDILLKNVSEKLKKIPGVGNDCYRVGGDEFIIILTHQQMDLLEEILDEIKALFTKPWMIKETDYYCTMSMGIVRFPANGDTVQELIKKAEIALYTAKCSGKNRVEFYRENIESDSSKRLDMEKNMRNAARDSMREFEVYFQPIVDILQPGSPCVGAEALIRWNSQEMGIVSPADFIPLAEYLGLINPIGHYALEQACQRCCYWNESGHPEYKVNVNLSVVQLLQNDIVERIRKVLEKTGIKPYNLVLEVTEGLAINDMSRMKKILGSIRSLGVRVALDDFGTGYSSLNYIREMPIDIIKIDRCFIMDIGKDEFSSAFVKMVSELANAIHVKVCVEGVETREQIEALQGSKIQMVQGYYFGKPMRVEEFEKKYL